jgi:hypothetical protein
MSTGKLKDWEILWGIGFSLVGGMAALVAGASFVAGDLNMSLWFSLLTLVSALGAFVAFDPNGRTKSAPGTEHPYCTGCGDRHDGPRCYS